MTRKTLLIAVALCTGAPGIADPLAESRAFLCSATTVTVCGPDGECVPSAPGELDVPQFLIVDLESKRLSTTLASGENRATEIRSLVQEGDTTILQGSQQGRAFSLVVDRATGHASIAIALDGLAIGVFGSCTPTPVR